MYSTSFISYTFILTFFYILQTKKKDNRLKLLMAHANHGKIEVFIWKEDNHACMLNDSS